MKTMLLKKVFRKKSPEYVKEEGQSIGVPTATAVGLKQEEKEEFAIMTHDSWDLYWWESVDWTKLLNADFES